MSDAGVTDCRPFSGPWQGGSTSDGGGSVTVRQCVDYSTQVVRQAGQPVDAIADPVCDRRPSTASKVKSWLLLRINEPTTENFTQCSEEGP